VPGASVAGRRDTEIMGESVEPITPELVLVDPELAGVIRRKSSLAPFRVAFVCTGNRFRSALAAAAFRSVSYHLPVEVDSYGTVDIGSAQPLPEAVSIAAAYGLDVSGHLARSLGTADLSQRSLVVGFEPQHVTAAVDIAGARSERTFLLRELNDLIEQVDAAPNPEPIERAIQTVARADLRRRMEPRRWLGREIADPMGLTQPEQHAIGLAVCGGAIKAAQELFGSVR
jgi:protein-tyrosine-phosphatase